MADAIDCRQLQGGREIPTESYSDQPYIVQTDDGAWLCCVTTGPGHEGARGQHVATLRSADQGRTWSEPVAVEPADSPENSYAVMLKAPGCGRVFIFYNHNTDNVREVRRHDGKGAFQRVDSLGHYVFRYSDDHGRTWSPQRYDIPQRLFECDRANVYGGALCFFWNVGKPFIHRGAAFVPLHKVGEMGEGFFARSEGVLLRSANLLTERDPAQAAWETLPEGEVGLRAPPDGGPIAEEQSTVVLSDGSFRAVYRTVSGHPAESYSRNGGRTWTKPAYVCFADGRRVKHPRAANFAWRCANGKYLYWFHNHGGRFIGGDPQRLNTAYEDRNPVWLSAGVEAGPRGRRRLVWSEPEIALYDDDSYVRISYPDLVEEGGCYYLTETQKDVARVHEIPGALLEGMWGGLERRLAGAKAARPEPVAEGLLLALAAKRGTLPAEVQMPALPAFTARDHSRLDYGTKDLRAGFSLDLWLRLDSWAPGQMILDSRTAQGQGLALATTPRGTLQLILNDGRCDCRWESDPAFRLRRWHHVAAIVDGGPKVISFVVDGRLCDGGEWRQFGWGRFNPGLRHANGAAVLRIGTRLQGAVRALRVYGRALKTFEAVRNCDAV